MNCTAISQTFIDTHRQEIRTTLLVLAAISAALALLAATDALLPNHISNVLKYPQANAVSFTLLSLAFLAIRSHLEKKAPKPPPISQAEWYETKLVQQEAEFPLIPDSTSSVDLTMELFRRIPMSDYKKLRLLNKAWYKNVTLFTKQWYHKLGGSEKNPLFADCMKYFYLWEVQEIPSCYYIRKYSNSEERPEGVLYGTKNEICVWLKEKKGEYFSQVAYIDFISGKISKIKDCTIDNKSLAVKNKLYSVHGKEIFEWDLSSKSLVSKSKFEHNVFIEFFEEGRLGVSFESIASFSDKLFMLEKKESEWSLTAEKWEWNKKENFISEMNAKQPYLRVLNKRNTIELGMEIVFNGLNFDGYPTMAWNRANDNKVFDKPLKRRISLLIWDYNVCIIEPNRFIAFQQEF